MIIGFRKHEFEIYSSLRSLGLSDVSAISYMIDTCGAELIEVMDEQGKPTDTESMDELLSVEDEEQEPDEAEA